MAFDLINELSPYLQNEKPAVSIPVHHKILATLHFLAQGSYQKSVGQDFLIPMAQQTLSKCIRNVVSVVINQLAFYIHFPIMEQEKNNIKQGFLNNGGFPGIVGAIDCTHIAIQAPPYENPEMPGILFLNRKGYYSINTQVIVDSSLKILAINAKFPGSVHDSAIWSTSQVKQHMEQNFVNGDNSSWFIGDSGYPLQPFLITPILGENLTNQESTFNRVHKISRNVVERFNGVFKGRFRCLLKHRVLHYKPVMAAKIIYACAIFHNICVMRNLIQPNIVNHDDLDNNERFADAVNVGRNWHNEGRATRQRIIEDYF